MSRMVDQIAKLLRAAGALAAGAAILLCAGQAEAVTYANQSVPFAWIDAASHTKVSWNSPTYFFSNTGGCGTTQPTIDDTLSNPIPIGFNFMYGGKLMNFVRIMSNGRIHLVSTIETPNIDNTTCGYGSPVTQLPYQNASMNYTMRIYGNDLDPTRKADIPGYNTACIDGTNCYVSFAQLGTAPYRQFVVTWNNVPEWASGSTTTGNYNLQIILQENGEFIYQYGAVTQGPGAATAQVGWQVDSTDYDVPSVGFPGTNTAIKFYIPGPVAEYRMEQPSWSTAPGQVLDTSGNGRHGTRVGNAQTVSGGRVCRGANIPSNTGTGTIDAIDTGISVAGTVGSSGTITFWYKSTPPWSGGGSQDSQLFDATIVNNGWFFLVKRSNGALQFTVRDSGGTNRTATTAAIATAANTWRHIAVSWNFNNLAGTNQDRLFVYVDGVQQATSAFTTASTISNTIGTLYIGDNRSGFTGVNGTGNSANGVIDEFRIYDYEGGSGLVQRDYAQTQQCLDHYAITLVGTGLTCKQTQVTITAHDSAHGNVIMPNNTTLINISTSDGLGDWTLSSGYGTFTPVGSNLGTAKYVFNGEFQVVLLLSHSTPGTISINVTDGQITELSPAEDPNLVISACVSSFNACELSSPRCNPPTAGYDRLYTKLAGTSFVLDLVALQSNGTLAASVNNPVTVDLLANSNTGVALGGNSCPVSQTAVISLGSVALTSGRGPAAGVSAAAGAYRDVRVRFTCSTANCPPAGLTTCSTDNFAVRPQSFTVTSSNATQTGTSGAPTIKAGVPMMNLTASSVAGYSGTPLLDNTKVVGTPTAGTISGVFSAAPVATGVAAGSSFAYSEVGNVGLNANAVYDSSFTSVDQPSDCIVASFSNVLAGGKYGCSIGSSAVPQTTGSSGFGRFIPDHFALSLGSLATRADISPACTPASAFTYMGEQMDAAFTLTAQNTSNGSTLNYAGAYAKLGLTSFANFNFGARSGTANLTPRIDSGSTSAGSWSNGVASVALTTAILRSTPDNPDGPYAGLQFGIAPVDSDAVAMNALDLDVDNNAVNDHKSLGVSTEVRFGRLMLRNALGAKTSALPVPVMVQTWQGSAFATNTLDNCTRIPRSAIVLDGYTGALAPGGGNCKTFVQQSPVAFSAGVGTLTLAAPTGGVTGSVRLTPNLYAAASGNYCASAASGETPASGSNLVYLLGRWNDMLDPDGNASTMYDDNPSARAAFGLFGSQPDRLIYQREYY